MTETANKNGDSNTLLLAVNAVLMLIFLWMVLPRIGIFVQIAITLVPFYFLAHRLSPAIRGTLERVLIAFPLACLWLIPLMFISFVPLFSLGKLAIVVLWLLIPVIIALKFEWNGIGASLGRIQQSFSSSRRLVFVLLLSVIVAYSFSGLIASAGLPRTDATAFLNRAVFVKTALRIMDKSRTGLQKNSLVILRLRLIRLRITFTRGRFCICSEPTHLRSWRNSMFCYLFLFFYSQLECLFFVLNYLETIYTDLLQLRFW